MAAKKRTQSTKSEYVFWGFYGMLALGSMILGALIGVVFGWAIDLPRVEELEYLQPRQISVLYSANGEMLDQFATEKRILVRYEEIPENLKQAIISSEDKSFFTHPGIDVRRMLVTIFWNDLIMGNRWGGSTITMQLSKIRFTSTGKTIERKIKDIFYAINVEKEYSKEQIFTFYANQVSMGHGRYGVAAATDFYFHKELKDISLPEAAMLAGIIQSPGRHSPINRPDRALYRRNWVLGEMLENGFIARDVYEDSLAQPLGVMGRDDLQSPAPYYVEWIRQSLTANYSSEEIWESGLKIYTTLDLDIQKEAQRALRDGLRKYDRENRGWAGPAENILEEEIDIDEYTHPDWSKLFYKGQMIHGLVLQSSNASAEIRLGSYTANIALTDMAWTGAKSVSDVLKPGDVALFTLKEVDREERIIKADLDQVPEVQGAIVVLDNRTGAIRAMVGGFDFNFSKFNRATQALRQPGSIFKPFTYIAAMEAGFSPNDRILDQPVQFEDGLGRPYSPTNWDDKYKGLITIAQAMAESRNVPTVRLANAIGPEVIAETAKRFGLKQDIPPFLSIALGSVELTLEEIVSAFSSFPNHGVRAEPYSIQRVEDTNSVILQEHTLSVHDALVTQDVADKMLYLFQEVIRRGSGRSLLPLGHPLGGKTGTTNDATDVWFVGFTRNLTAGVWIGFDDNTPLGERVYGSTLALPVWKDFMSAVLKEMKPLEFESAWKPGPYDSGRVIGDLDSGEFMGPVRRQEYQVEDISPPPGG